jgi:3-phenylpropionate/trans-cinnamate dioxygenase ferredoxin reductase subunit
MHVVIIGNGVAGVAAARHMRKLDSAVRITIVSGESDHHWSRTALMYIYMGHMRYEDTKPYQDHFWAKNRIALVRGWVTGLDVVGKTLQLDGTRALRYDKLLIATGSQPNRFGWPGQDLDRVGGMYSVQDLAKLEAASPGMRHAALVGGGLIGIELAEMWHSRGIHVTMLVREDSYWLNVLPAEESAMVNEVIRAEGVDLKLGTELQEIIDDGAGRACAVITSEGERIDVGFVGLTAGVRPNVEFLKDSGIEIARGVLVDRTLRTNIADIYACGDCAEIKTPEGERNLIQAVWYTGRMMGETVAGNLLGAPRDYDPGIWFNSAKFFDLEYQVYGQVPSGGAARRGEGKDSLLWVAEDRRHSVRIVHEEGKVIGFNLMGIRYRHRTCEAWIAEGRSVDYVLANLRKAHFDPEFYRRWDKDIVSALGSQR